MLRRHNSAFTLIELLVVIAIIALLVSILLPSLKTARELARITVCATNLRNIHTTAHTYVGSFDGYLPAIGCGYNEGESDNAILDGKATGITQLMAWQANRPSERIRGNRNKAGWSICPSDRDPSHGLRTHDPRWISYTHLMQAFESGAPRRANDPSRADRRAAIPLTRIGPSDDVFRPSEVIMYAEAKSDRSLGCGHWQDKIANPPYPTYGTWAPRWFLFRHKGDSVLNLIFFDGHVENTTFDTWDYQCGNWQYWR
jgi:prepilin-type N-terminal cleavage/methylation domain-containing protein/prepilin-type processing-associated H-X9-DG protein